MQRLELRWKPRGAALNLLREGFGIFAIRLEGKRLLQIAGGGGGVIVMEVGAGEDQVGFGAGF